ncbi:MAG: DNA polymerase Y family protein [Deltaproteobacteria bacterium]|nr:DNA polymerase Y family protein [Deltaproteobacteria bacterium]
MRPTGSRRAVGAAVAAAPQSARGGRFLGVVLPAFRLERCGYRAEDPAVVVDEVRNAVRVVACTPGAEALGVRVGMSATEARALVAGLVVEPLDREGESEDQASLVQALRVFTDRVAVAGPAEVIFEVSGITAIFDGEEALLSRVRGVVESFGHLARLAMSGDPRASLALARWREGDTVVEEGGLASACLALPLSALRPSQRLLDGLAQVGIRTLGALAALSPAAVAGRYGQEGVTLHRLGRGQPLQEGWEEPRWDDPLAYEVTLPEPTEMLTALLFVLQGVIGQLVEALEAREQRAVRLTLHLALDGEDPLSLPVRVGRPTRQQAELMEAVRRTLEGLRIAAPVVGLGLVLAQAAEGTGRQPGLLERVERAEELPALMARLEDALGEAALFRARIRERWRPETSWVAERWGPDAPLFSVRERERADPVAIQGGEWADLPRPRPALLLPKPQALAVDAAGPRPRRLSLEEGWVQVREALGPERLEGEWWTESPFARDYWEVELGGRWAWIFSEGDRWYLHGWFD